MIFCDNCGRTATYGPPLTGDLRKDFLEGKFIVTPRYWCPICKRKLKEPLSHEDYQLWLKQYDIS